MLKNIQVYKPTNPESQHLFRWEVYDRNFEERMALYPLQAPAGQAYQSWGLTKIGGEFVHPFERKVVMLNVCVAERILPSKVVQQAANAKAAVIEERESRKVGRKEMAQLKTAVIEELLPKSHIRVNSIPVLITPDYLIVGSGSAKQADDVVDFLMRAIRGTDDQDVRGYTVSIAPLAGKDNQKWIRQLAVGGQDDTDRFHASNSIALKGESVIRIKDIQVSEDEVQQHINPERNVIELGLTYFNDQGDVDLLFSITDSLIIKRLRFSDILTAEISNERQENEVGELDANLCILVPTITTMLKTLELSLASGETAQQAEDEEEDEL